MSIKTIAITCCVKCINSIQFLKGPEGSMFGANTDSTILLDTRSKSDASIAEASVRIDSFGLFDEQVRFDKNLLPYCKLKGHQR